MKANYRTLLAATTILLLAASVLGYGEPAAPLHFTRGASSTFNWSNFANVQTDAIAGNITQLTITGISQTRSWQGFYGNVTGWITLDDAQNYTFYNWSAAEPRGYVYATLVSHADPSWLNVQCFVHATNASAFDTYYNITQDAYDNVTNTFNRTLADISTPQAVYIVSNTFTTCPAMTIWQDDNAQNDNFVNYLMWDSTGGTDAWVFGSIIENKDVSNKTDKNCYNGQPCDFQLLVAENGHGTDTAVTPYYIWVDITA